ncbi:ubiquinone anaerobic biosynthesis accessory factor UbiT [Marinobacter sp. VGCF2001]|uniref:ubiquinone anaerobic biosynthesis accessory factor UbiT n=1 Tax=Marinobacter sp. VGCF2001 TaxID=3417189 RepID=UPI003CF7C37D
MLPTLPRFGQRPTPPGLMQLQRLGSKLQHNPLADQTLAVLREYAPSPAPLLQAIDQRIPLPLKQLAAEEPLNRLFAEAIAEGEFEDFEGRRIRLEINGGQPGITLGYWAERLRVINGPGDTTIRGSISAFRTLAAREQDPDQLFFQRRLVIEGDTELGLALKNLLDSLDWHVQLRDLLKPW